MSENTAPLPIVDTPAPKDQGATTQDKPAKKGRTLIAFSTKMPVREGILWSIIALLLATGPLHDWILVPGILILATGAWSLLALLVMIIFSAIGKTPKSRQATTYRIAYALILLWVALIMF